MKKYSKNKIEMGNLTIIFLLLYSNVIIFSLESKPKKTHFTINLVHAFQDSTTENLLEINLITNNTK